MPIGTGTFHPNGKFAAPRSYWSGIIFDISGYTVHNATTFWYWRKITDPDETWTIVPDERFLTWSSNRWTLDHILTDFYLQTTPMGTPAAQPYTLQIVPSFVSLRPALLFQFNGINFGEYHFIPFPNQPQTYWLPKPL